MEAEAALQEQRQSAFEGVVPASRPSSSGSAVAARQSIEAVLTDAGLRSDEVSDTVEAVWNLDPVWTRNRIEREKVGTNTIGCWFSSHAAAHPRGYVKLNLRNTARPGGDPSIKIGANVSLHALAIVAKGDGALLLSTCGMGGNEVSRLIKSFNHDLRANTA